MPPPPFAAIQPGCPWTPRALLARSRGHPGQTTEPEGYRNIGAPRATARLHLLSCSQPWAVTSLRSGPYLSWAPRGRAPRAEGAGRRLVSRGEALPGGVATVSAGFGAGGARPRRGAQGRDGSGSRPSMDVAGPPRPRSPGGREIRGPRPCRGPGAQPRLGRRMVRDQGRTAPRSDSCRAAKCHEACVRGWVGGGG